MNDQLQRFIFDAYQIRGEIARAHNSFNDIIKKHDYSTEVANLVGELLIATSLITATLKFAGKITVQLQGDGPLNTAVINANQNLEVRGTANVSGDTAGLSFKQLVGKGHLMITISPEEGERYQGIVALEKDSLSECLEDYFIKSEQLATRIILHASAKNTAQAAGLLLQTLPAVDENHEADFQHVSALASTVKEEELYTLANDELLYRLYHQETVRLFEVQPIRFQCSCSKERCLTSLASITAEEILEMLNEQGSIDMHCEYCASDYHFEKDDLQILLNDEHGVQH
ncbi:Hsp33 family molecular chaperone HslO [Psychromonas sp. MB-3u-54]|uniref:Hsp33 family molecular chaperone HslO n=1 Tax=Psychromonas sp. MB-3u-54 TaxID=2058319 RepID=UPI000C3493F5|nr:Hsp33 family molecular chaperone HslO [Psychromonas sp. MB-3u-54]PKH02547.1 Hsp33 family molecular chaperone HslO [Psychromonas sp. MB-3u-54]